MAKHLQTEEVMTRLARKYPAPEWAFMEQVPDGTGMYKRRTADAIAMNLWPSRGMELWGFEVKVGRGDWLSELRNPAKSDGFMKYCDRWFLVIGHKELVKEGELPSTWGLITPHGAGLTVKVAAPLLHKRVQAFDRAFVAAVLRQASQTLTMDSRLREARFAGQQEGKKSAEESHEWDKKQHQELKDHVNALETAAGIHISTYSGLEQTTRIGEVVRLILNGGVTEVAESLDRGIRQMEVSLRQMKKTRNEMRGPDQNELLPKEEKDG